MGLISVFYFNIKCIESTQWGCWSGEVLEDSSNLLPTTMLGWCACMSSLQAQERVRAADSDNNPSTFLFWYSPLSEGQQSPQGSLSLCVRLCPCLCVCASLRSNVGCVCMHRWVCRPHSFTFSGLFLFERPMTERGGKTETEWRRVYRNRNPWARQHVHLLPLCLAPPDVIITLCYFHTLRASPCCVLTPPARVHSSCHKFFTTLSAFHPYVKHEKSAGLGSAGSTETCCAAEHI